MNPKIAYAVNLFISNLSFKLKNTMIDIGESNDYHDVYVQIFSSIVVSLTYYCIKLSRLSLTSNAQESTNTSQKLKRSHEYSCTEMNQIIAGASTEEDVPAGFTSINLCTRTKKHSIYCVSNSSKFIALKVLESSIVSWRNMHDLDAELEFSKVISHKALRSCIAKTMFQNKPAIMLEWAYGYPISLISGMGSFDIKEFLVIAREIASALSLMHSNRIMNLNLSCDHVIYDPKSKSVKIISLGSCSKFSSKPICITNNELTDRDLKCISPELTGRVNREIDFRSNFYSIGVIFFKMLTGRYLFIAENSLHLIYLHILQDPLPISTINPNIPGPLSDMVSKLLKKNAEDRYLSAKGIIYDLDLMISEYDNDNALSSIILDQHNISETFHMPQQLYGRAIECSELRSAFEQLDYESFELVFVSGRSGTGELIISCVISK